MRAMAGDEVRSRLRALRLALEKLERRGAASLSERELYDLPRLYRYAASRIARLEASSRDADALAEARELVARAHAHLHRGLGAPRERWTTRLARFFLAEVPAAIRAEWRLVAVSFALVYGLAALAFFAVRDDLEIAYSLLSPEVVAQEIAQLEATGRGEPFRGNFTFGLERSATASGWIMTHNIGVGILFFASGLIPPLYLYLLATNGLMLGTYTAVASHWNQAGEISSILWCHGTIEIQALVLAGAAGLVLVRAWIAPGPWTRRRAMQLERARAWRLFAPVFPLLVLSGLIEGYVSPHAPVAVRIATAIVTGTALVLWIVFGGRDAASEQAAAAAGS